MSEPTVPTPPVTLTTEERVAELERAVIALASRTTPDPYAKAAKAASAKIDKSLRKSLAPKPAFHKFPERVQ